MHQSLHLRQQIAQEAARLISGGYSSDFSKARQRAARQVFRGKLSKAELPTFAEIQAFLIQQRVETGISKNAPKHLLEELILCLKNLAGLLQDPGLVVEKPADEQMILPGFVLRVYSPYKQDELEEIFVDAGPRLKADLLIMPEKKGIPPYIRLKTQHLELEVFSLADHFFVDGLSISEYVLQLESLQLKETQQCDLNLLESLVDWSYAFELIPLLKGVRVDSYSHPEGDLCYHAQQVYQLGIKIVPYDTEFLEACLFHDLGYLKNYHDPQSGSVDLLAGIATERTLFFISELPIAHEYLKTGQIPRGIRKSPDFDLLIELARLDRQGREMGVDVPDLEEIEEYLSSIQ